MRFLTLDPRNKSGGDGFLLGAAADNQKLSVIAGLVPAIQGLQTHAFENYPTSSPYTSSQ
jgi:hypothetical protein